MFIKARIPKGKLSFELVQTMPKHSVKMWNTDTLVGWWGFDHNSHIFYQIAFITLTQNNVYHDSHEIIWLIEIKSGM